MKFKSLIFLYLTVLGSLYSQEQLKEFKTLKFRNISLKQGLSQSSVLCILQDENGFMWFGTRDGLNKYDGHTFKTYRYNSQDSSSISHSYIKALFEDSLGNLWVGTRHGLNKYIPKTDTFERVKIREDEPRDTHNEIWDIVQGDKNNELWIATNAGLIYLNTKNSNFVKYSSNDDTGLSSSLVRGLLRIKDGNLWVKTVKGIDFLDRRTNTFKNYELPIGDTKEINENNLSVLNNDSQGNVWLGFQNGLAYYDEKKDSFNFFKGGDGNILVKDQVRSICEDYYGKLWVGTYNGLYIIDANLNYSNHYEHDENVTNSLSQNSIYKIFQDNKGDMWIGTYSGGVDYYDRSYDFFKHVTVGTNNTKLNYKVVSSILETPFNELWIGTEGGGVNVYNKNTGRFKYYTASDDPNSISANNVKALIRDHKGDFWIGTHDGGVNVLKYSEFPHRFKKYKNIPNDPNSISDDRVISLLEDHDHNIWIGTSGGLNVLDNHTKSIIRISDPLKIMGQIIYTIVETKDEKNLLVGSNFGLAKIDLSTRAISPVNFVDSEKRTVTVLSVYEHKNQIWIGTEGNGLYNYDLRSKKITKYGKEQGIPNDVVYGIVPDNSNNIWLSTNYGLCRINLESSEIKNFYESDGLQGNEFNYGAYLKDSSGNLIFGGTNGFNIFNPDDIIENTFVPPVSITSFRVNNEPYLNFNDSISEINLKYFQNVLNFDFVALSYSQPNRNQYAFKLEGFDKDWNYVGNRKSATYTNLDEGSYTFKVKASNNDGVWNDKGVSINLRVLPAPWYTWWAYLIYFVLTIVGFLIVRRYSLLRIKEKNELKLERIEKERMKEVNKMKLQLFTNISHDLRTPITLIIGPLARLLEEKNIDVNITEKIKVAYKNSLILLELANQFLDFRKNDIGKLRLFASKSDIVQFSKEIKEVFNELANSKKIDFSLKYTKKSISIWIDKEKIKKVIFNLLSNAFKFTPVGGTIDIELSIVKKSVIAVKHDYLEIIIKDSGRGISESLKEHIFERYNEFGENPGAGIGLDIVKSYVELHKGEIEVESEEGKGACFKVFLPLGKEHLKKHEIVKKPKNKSTNDFKIEKTFYIDNQLDRLKQQTVIFEDNTEKILSSSILIVEDNTELRSFIKEIFKDRYNIYEAREGKSAIDIAERHDVDLIISDVMMPVMNGIEMCSKLKLNIKTSHIPVILLTAKTSMESKNLGYETGADAYVTKPFDSKILKLKVSNVLESRKNLINKFKKDIILQPKELTITSADEKFLEKAIELVELNIYDSDFTIDHFLKELGMSRSSLYRKLKALTGEGPSEFIKNIKLKKAAQLIGQTEMNISQIAYDLGFNDLKHFRNSFKAQFNKLPSQYRD